MSDKVYVVVPDESERSVIVDAALEPSGYTVKATGDGTEALSMIMKEPPDVIILDLAPQGLSGRDILVALQSQALDVPSIIVADRGAEQEALKAFRLGAKDYIQRPLREAELIQVVERALRDVRMRREREQLINEVKRASSAVEQRLRELKTLMGIGKSVAALQDVEHVFDRVIRAARQITKADAAGCYLRNDEGQMVLRAGQNLSRTLLERMDEPIEDDLAMLVTNSQEPYRGEGDGLKRMKPAQEGAHAVVYAPMVVNEQSLGVVWVANARTPFEPYTNDIMSALADYAAIAVFNAHLFATMRERSDELERSLAEQSPAPNGSPSVDTMAFVNQVRAPLTQVLGNLSMFKNGEMGVIPPGNRAAVDVLHRQVSDVIDAIDSLIPQGTGGL